MKRESTSPQTIAAAWLLALLCALPAAAADGETVKLGRIAGDVQIRHQDETKNKWQDAEEAGVISPGWELRTGKASKALLVFPKGNTVTLRADSFVRILELKPGGGALIESDKPGGLLVSIKHKLDKNNDFTLKTPSAHAIVRGTEYGASIQRDGLDDDGKPKYVTGFYGYEGEVCIENEFGGQMLGGDQTIRAIAGLIPGVAVPSLPGVAGDFFSILTSEDPEGAAKDMVEDRIEDEIRDKIPGGFGGFPF